MLPQGWEACETAEGATYYFNIETNNTTWTLPTPPPSPMNRVVAKKYIDPMTVEDSQYWAEFWEYANYYGEEQSRLFYGECWSPPIGSLNPTVAIGSADTCPNSNSNSHQPAKKISMCIRVSNEIVSTEITFVRNMSNLINIFVIPLQNLNVISTSKQEQLFSNIQTLLPFNTKLMQDLLDDQKRNPISKRNIGKIFKMFAPFLKMFNLYLTNFESASRLHSELLNDNSSYKRFIEKAESNAMCNGLTLTSLLIMPVQRVPRYKMLLDELIKQHTVQLQTSNPNLKECEYDNYDKELKVLKEAGGLVSKSASHNNEMIRRRENHEKLLKIQNSFEPSTRINLLDDPSRLFIKSGTLTKLSRRAPQKHTVWLFSDMLVYGDKRMNGLFVVKRVITLNCCSISAAIDDDSNSNSNTSSNTNANANFNANANSRDTISGHNGVDDSLECMINVSTKEKSFVLVAPSKPDRQTWVKAIDQAILKLQSKQTRDQDGQYAAIWKSDKSTSNCTICTKSFTMFFRKHHCRNCGVVVCGDCSASTVRLKHLNSSNRVRVCDLCKKDGVGVNEEEGGERGERGGSFSFPRLSFSLRRSSINRKSSVTNAKNNAKTNTNGKTNGNGDGNAAVTGGAKQPRVVSEIGRLGGAENEESDSSRSSRDSRGSRSSEHERGALSTRLRRDFADIANCDRLSGEGVNEGEEGEEDDDDDDDDEDEVFTDFEDVDDGEDDVSVSSEDASDTQTPEVEVEEKYSSPSRAANNDGNGNDRYSSVTFPTPSPRLAFSKSGDSFGSTVSSYHGGHDVAIDEENDVPSPNKDNNHSHASTCTSTSKEEDELESFIWDDDDDEFMDAEMEDSESVGVMLPNSNMNFNLMNLTSLSLKSNNGQQRNASPVMNYNVNLTNLTPLVLRSSRSNSVNSRQPSPMTTPTPPLVSNEANENSNGNSNGNGNGKLSQFLPIGRARDVSVTVSDVWKPPLSPPVPVPFTEDGVEDIDDADDEHEHKHEHELESKPTVQSQSESPLPPPLITTISNSNSTSDEPSTSTWLPLRSIVLSDEIPPPQSQTQSPSPSPPPSSSSSPQPDSPDTSRPVSLKIKIPVTFNPETDTPPPPPPLSDDAPPSPPPTNEPEPRREAWSLPQNIITCPMFTSDTTSSPDLCKCGLSKASHDSTPPPTVSSSASASSSSTSTSIRDTQHDDSIFTSRNSNSGWHSPSRAISGAYTRKSGESWGMIGDDNDNDNENADGLRGSLGMRKVDKKKEEMGGWGKRMWERRKE